MGGVALRSGVRTLVRPVVGDRGWQALRDLDRRGRALHRTVRQRVERRRILLDAVRTERRAAAELRPIASDLRALAEHFGTDKWGDHRYAQHYQRHFEPLRGQPVTVLEIGIGGPPWAGVGGESLRMWKHYFPSGRIYGLDIHDKAFVREPRIHTFRGDQSDPAVLHRIVAQMGPPDIVIDDGSHRPAHVIASFEVLFPMLAPHGIYVVEDTQTSYWPEWGGAEAVEDQGTSMARLRALTDGLNYEEFVLAGYSPTYTDLHVVAAHFYHNLVVIEKGRNTEGTRKTAILKKRYAGS